MVIIFTGIEYVLCGIVLAFVQEVNIKNEAASCEGHLQLMKTEYSCSGHGKYSGIAYLRFLFSFGSGIVFILLSYTILHSFMHKLLIYSI